ncbi:MAG: TIGR01212 family radical SAM protein [Clostridia bacterium]|nr:TIGR01212 family radical SAM protein [Clostridia bacterium]
MDIKEQLREWNGRRYYSLDCCLKKTFGRKLYKLSLNGGMTCPNRDGTVSTGGCIFCSEGGSGEFAQSCLESTDIQIEKAKALVKNKSDGSGYIAYFQAFTNTYAPVNRLRELFMPVIERDDIDVLSIATRPDCLEDDKLKLLEELVRIKPVWVELGLQTIHEESARFINRGYELPCFDRAVRELKSIGVNVIVHTIIGLPGENAGDMISSAKYVSDIGADGIKLQLLHILRGTRLAELYEAGKVTVLSEDEYTDIIARIIGSIRPDIVIHRLTGDGDKRLLIAPLWSGNKLHVLNSINHRLKEKNIIQGSMLR